MSLGFTRVAKATSSAIHEVTTQHLSGLASLFSENAEESRNYSENLQKLAFTMSYRVANEKRVYKFLDE